MSGDLGRPTVLSKEEEDVIRSRVVLMGDWGFPLTKTDLREVVKSYLDGMGRTTKFVDNRPGKDWVSGFMRRHPDLSARTASLIKRSRAALSPEIVIDFFKKFEVSAAGVEASNMFNYDETNLRDVS